MPGDSLHKIRKAAGMDVDAVVMDLEDGVALSQKTVARQTVCEALQTVDFGSSARYVRLNPVGSNFFAEDLASTLPGKPDGYVLPKVTSAATLERLDDELDRAEDGYGWPRHSIALLAIIESALGVMRLDQIAQASPRLVALMFGAEDLASDLGAIRTKQGDEVACARSALVIAAAAYGLLAIDMVYFDLNDPAGFEQECRVGRCFGYAGKMVIHPKQVAIANRLFAPSPEEIAQAERIILAHQAHQRSGIGAFELDGRMVDMPVVRAAERVLRKARSARL
jgi:citrate lyase beta subunit